MAPVTLKVEGLDNDVDFEVVPGSCGEDTKKKLHQRQKGFQVTNTHTFLGKLRLRGMLDGITKKPAARC